MSCNLVNLLRQVDSDEQIDGSPSILEDNKSEMRGFEDRGDYEKQA
jgi:hypothetical protein